MKIRIFDIFSLLLAIAVLLVFSLLAYGKNRSSTHLSVRAGGNDWIYPLTQNGPVQFEGPIGVTTVLIENGTARVLSSPCRDKICINMGNLEKAGDWSACLPNRVFARIEGGGEGEVDTISH